VRPGAEPQPAEAEAQPQAAAQAAAAEAQAQAAATEAESAASATEAEAKAAATERALIRNSTQSVAVDYLAKLWLFTTALLAVATWGTFSKAKATERPRICGIASTQSP
jgi:hypothetical protein